MIVWSKIMDKSKIDIRKVKKASDDYTVSTGITVTVINKNGSQLYKTGDTSSCCALCPYTSFGLHSCSGGKDSLFGSYEAHRFGGKYIFFCEMGMVFWVSPVLYEAKVELSLICGPAIIIDFDDYHEASLNSDIMTEEDTERFLAEIRRMEKLDTKRVSALSEMLFYTAGFLYTGDNTPYLQSVDDSGSNSAVSEYIRFIKISGGETSEKSYPLEKEKEFLHNITTGNKERSQEILNEILGHILFKSGADLEKIKTRVLELITVLSRAAIDNGADSELILAWNNRYFKDINTFKTIDTLITWLSSIIRGFADLMFGYMDIKHVDVIYRAVDYVNNNYMHKITLEDAADAAGLSPSYFCRIFRNEMGSSFISYLSNIRVEKAKRLLLKKSISIVDVSNMVGFEDQSYFTKVFKKTTGVTPGKYREARGKFLNK